jgi:hypothetical protein
MRAYIAKLQRKMKDMQSAMADKNRHIQVLTKKVCTAFITQSAQWGPIIHSIPW